MNKAFSRRHAGFPFVALVVEGKALNPQGIFAIRMLPDQQLGGALVGVGERVAISWADIERDGLEAFRELWLIEPGTPPNVDFARGKGSLRAHRTLLLEVEDHVVLSAQGTWARCSGAREQDRTRLALPVDGHELAAAIRGSLARK